MKCEITIEGDVLMIRLSGVIRDDDLLEVLSGVKEAESRTPVTPARLTDVSGLTELHLTFVGMNELVRLRRAMKFPNDFKSAIVAPEPGQYGFARMFQTLNDHPQIEIMVFREMAAAREWVGCPKAG